MCRRDAIGRRYHIEIGLGGDLPSLILKMARQYYDENMECEHEHDNGHEHGYGTDTNMNTDAPTDMDIDKNMDTDGISTLIAIRTGTWT
jgi:hypothetical protein